MQKQRMYHHQTEYPFSFQTITQRGFGLCIALHDLYKIHKIETVFKVLCTTHRDQLIVVRMPSKVPSMLCLFSALFMGLAPEGAGPKQAWRLHRRTSSERSPRAAPAVAPGPAYAGTRGDGIYIY